MAAADCVLHGTLGRYRPRPGSNQALRCRDFLFVVDVMRYTRDAGAAAYFPQAVFTGDDLYDVIVSDGDCRLQVTLAPALTRQVEVNTLRRGAKLADVTFIHAPSAQLPQGGAQHSFVMQSAEVRSHGGGLRTDVDSLPWFGSSHTDGHVVPLRANRSVFLPLWNNVDQSGAAWSEALPPEEEDEEDDEGPAAPVTVSELRVRFRSGRHGAGARPRPLVVRIINKSSLVYFGKTDRNCVCPYKAMLEVCDTTDRVCVVLWNSVCVSWFQKLKPGDVISLRHYRVKQLYQGTPQDMEISVNSRNPSGQIRLLSESALVPRLRPPAPTYTFHSSKSLTDLPHGAVCDVIGLLTFVGRPERSRRRDGGGAELREYRWLQLEDGQSERPIVVKLFASSQPDVHLRLRPVSVVVVTCVKWTGPSAHPYLTNTTNTQVYSTGQHAAMSYRRLRPVRRVLRWIRAQDEERVLDRTRVGGCFLFPPAAVHLDAFMKTQTGELGFLRGAELQAHLDRLVYRERRSFCVQAKVTMVTYRRIGQEHQSLVWTSRPAPSSGPSPSSGSSPGCFRGPAPFPSPPSSPSSGPSPHRHGLPSPSSSGPAPPLPFLLTPRPVGTRTRKLLKRKLLPETTNRKCPRCPAHTDLLFESSLEFLEKSDEEESDVITALGPPAPPCPPAPPVAMATLPMRYDPARGAEQAAALTSGRTEDGPCAPALGGYYSLRLSVLSDGVCVDAIFLPLDPSPLLCPSLLSPSPPLSPSTPVDPLSPSPPLGPAPPHTHTNSWTSILQHGAFSTGTPPPSPVDLIATAEQLTNQRLLCVLEACHVGGAEVELLLSRAFNI